MNTHYSDNLKAVMQVNKNYTDKEIKASEERILSIVARNNVDFIDHTDEATYRFTAPANAKLLMLQSVAGNSVKYSPSVASDSTTAYQKTIPSYSPSIDRASASMNILGGMSYKINQINTLQNYDNTQNSVRRLIVNNKITVSGTSSSTFNASINSVLTNLKINHKYLFIPTVNNARLIFLGQAYTSSDGYIANKFNDTNNAIFSDTTNDNYKIYFYLGAKENTTYNDEFYINVFDLTEMGIDTNDVSVATSELLKRGIDINTYQAYDSGSIRDSAVSSVVSKDSNDTTIDTLAIDSNIQALDGYGWGINDNCYNYIDFNAKKFIKKVGIKTYSSQDIIATTGANYTNVIYAKIRKPNDYAGYNTYGQMDVNTLNNKFEVSSSYTYDSVANVGKILSTAESNMFWIGFAIGTPSEQMQNAINGLNLYYELATPVETDISQYLDGNEIEIEPNGTLSFESTYNAYVPSDVSYNGVIKHSLVTAIQHSRNGVVLETRLLPNSEAKYSWGITDGVRNTRVFCDDEGNAVNEGQLDVGNQDLGIPTYSLYSENSHLFYGIIAGRKITSTNLLCPNYSVSSSLTNMTLYPNMSNENVYFKNENFDVASIFKNAMNGVPLFYEKNETDTETLDDFDYFFDCEEGDTFTLVNTEQLQCYATYSFLIKEEKSNE